MKPNEDTRKNIERLLDFSEFTVRTLELYSEVHSTVARKMLLVELHHRLRALNGTVSLGEFDVHFRLLVQMINEVPGHPTEAISAVECAERLSVCIEQMLLSQHEV